MKKRSPIYILLLVAALSAFGCASPEKWNVLLVTFDTTRADHFGCYGKTDIETPTVDGLAEEGVRFARAFSTIPLTTPSHSTIMTGVYPLAHGVRDNGMFVLPDSQTTLAEILKENGWATAAAIGSFPLVKKFGVDQGFDFYDDRIAPPVLNFLGERALPKAGLYFDERPAARVNEALFPWLEENHDKPFFAWAHYFDPHQPFEPPPPYDQLYAHDLYDGEIAYSDESFGNLLDRLKELGVYDRTVVILAADHGEGRGEHNELTHSIQLYNSTLHVPLVVRTPDGAAGRVVETPVGTVDIMPTVLDLLGLPVPENVQGRSLASVIRSGPADELPDRVLYAETLSPRLSFGWGELRALIRDEKKYIFGPRPELFDIGLDPQELTNLVEADAKTADRMQRELARYMRENAGSDLAAAVEMDDETRQKLMALGYLGGGAGADEEIEEVLRPDGVAPQDRVGDINELTAVKQLLHTRRALPAREILLSLLEREPDSLAYLEMLAMAHLQLDNLDEAVATLERIRGSEGEGQIAGNLLLQLGTIYFYRQEYDVAEQMLRRSEAVQSDPFARYLLANIHAVLERWPQELEALESTLELDPTYAPARIDIAVRQAQAGDRQSAEENFLRAMRDEPYFSKAFYNYGAFLVEAGDYEGAVGYFKRAVELQPDYWRAYYALVSLHLALEQPDEAQSYYATLESRAGATPEAEQARRLMEEAA